MIRVMLAEDHAVVRAGLQQLLSTAADLELVGAARDGDEAVRLAAAEQPDVVLMDLSMPDVDGVEATRRIRAASPEVHVVILTSFSSRERILDALDAGAIGYLLKDAEPDEILRGIRAAAHGGSPLAPKAAGVVLAARRDARPAAELTARERDVLTLLGEGRPNKLIARELGITEKTVKAHLTRIFQAIGVTDRTAAALWAQRHRLGDRETG